MPCATLRRRKPLPPARAAFRLVWSSHPCLSETRSPRLAVLIDADNASAKIVDGLFEEIAKIGEASVRRIYGDFSNPRSKGWADTLSKHAIIPQQQFSYTTGKNASDITLVIDAMDLLHSGGSTAFVWFPRIVILPALPPASASKASMFSGSVSRKLQRASGRPVEGLYTPRTCCPVPRTVRMPPQLRSLFSPPAPPRPSSRRSSHRWKAKTAGCLWGSRKAACQPGFRLRSENLRLSQAERSGAKDKFVRNRTPERRLHAHSHKAHCRGTSETKDTVNKAADMRTSHHCTPELGAPRLRDEQALCPPSWLDLTGTRR